MLVGQMVYSTDGSKTSFLVQIDQWLRIDGSTPQAIRCRAFWLCELRNSEFIGNLVQSAH